MNNTVKVLTAPSTPSKLYFSKGAPGLQKRPLNPAFSRRDFQKCKSVPTVRLGTTTAGFFLGQYDLRFGRTNIRALVVARPRAEYFEAHHLNEAVMHSGSQIGDGHMTTSFKRSRRHFFLVPHISVSGKFRIEIRQILALRHFKGLRGKFPTTGLIGDRVSR